MSWVEREDLSNETKIVWLEDIEKFDYVREGLHRTTQRRGRISKTRFDHLIGWAEVAKQGPGITPYARRVWYLRSHDRYPDPEGVYATGCPAEAVDPRTVKLGVAGQWTRRCAGQKGDRA